MFILIYIPIELFLTNLILVVSLLVFMSCNNDDTVNLPSTFEITIDASFSSAEISWTQNIGINNDLFEENITEQFYELQNLTSATIYNLKIEAKNEIAYDSYPSFITYNSYQGPLSYGPNLTSSSFISYWQGIYDFISYSNENNPTSIYYNGVISYDYNDIGYPTKITQQNSNGAINKYDLEYIVE